MSALTNIIVDEEDQEGAKWNKHTRKNNHGILYKKNIFFHILLLSHFLVFSPLILRVLSIHIKEKETLKRKKKESQIYEGRQ
jgi:hypothetical protein